MEKESLGLGMASGLCLDIKEKRVSVILVQDESGKPLVGGQKGWGLPGGRIENGESPIDAMLREWEEEVGIKKSSVPIFFEDEMFAVKRNGDKGPYKHYVFPLSMGPDPQLRKTGYNGETGPPTWISLKSATSRVDIAIFQAHYEILVYYVARRMAPNDRNMAFLATELAKKLGIKL